MTHDQLAATLATSLRRPGYSKGFITWENIEFPDMYDLPSKFGAPFGTPCRPDIFAIQATLTEKNWRPVIYEIKVSRGDFHRDVRADKWKNYFRIAAYVRFACPAGLIGEIDLPPGAGLIVFENGKWLQAKRGRMNREWKLTQRQWMNLCLKRIQ
ncbi:hypothetical protein LCGC14_0960320 [marine sediment metagenome]|uniref:Uncharacterized protein n=1 Tax=marine sediment metagenome TaxID=412755 RepID=A0A0F9NJD2_9ZZZZ